MPKTLTALFNEHLRKTGESVRELAGEIKQLSQDDKAWYARQFVAEGYADSVTAKDATTGQDVTLA